MRIPYYPGCSLRGTGKEYELSAKTVLADFDIELVEMEDWNCCGAMEASSVDHLLYLSLPARTFALGNGNFNKVMMLCSACYQIHQKVKSDLLKDEKLKKEVCGILEKEIDLNIEVKHLLFSLISDIGMEKIREKVKVPLENIRAVPYYGCSINRPSRIVDGDDPNFPESLEKIIGGLGGQLLPFSCKTRCCGGTHVLTTEKISIGLVEKILSEAKNSQTDCIVVVCPLCHMALENDSLKLNSDIPILYFTQLIGIAFGHSAEELGLEKHLVSTEKLINSAL